jgi:hypothetical protein
MMLSSRLWIHEYWRNRQQLLLELVSLSAVVETLPLLSCSSAAPLDIDVVIKRARHRHATTCVIECGVQVCNRSDRHHDLQKRLLLQRMRHYSYQYLSKMQRFVLMVGRISVGYWIIGQLLLLVATGTSLSICTILYNESILDNVDVLTG